jgi:hypothetical protein
MSIREELIEKLDMLTEEQIAALLSIVEAFDGAPSKAVNEINTSDDPAIGFITGPTDFARRAEEILSEEITRKSGWTQKDSE